ncbi:MAG: Holliday junction resolvase RuvX [bacterium]
MRILAIDHGQARLGIAISDPLQITAQPVATLQNDENLIPNLKKIIDDYGSVTEIVVGLPKSLKGGLGPQAEKVQAFVAELEKNFEIKVVTWDERLTTVAAERDLISAGLSRKKRKKVIDKSAAAYILRNYLDSRKK